ncbi:MAG TPA: beta-propeller domain-containing protein [Pyrinomonadaceae bacterium]
MSAVIALSYGLLSRSTSANDAPADILAGPKPKKTLRPFKSEKELKDFFKTQAERDRRESQATGMANSASGAVTDSAASPTMAAKSEPGASKDDSITNTQHAGVDEGDIVKLHGDHLVILRRGRIFTVRIGDDTLKPIDSVNAYPPGIDPSNDWYDEMLIAQDTVAVIGYSYGRGGTEINLFDIDEDGRLAYRATYHLRSNDYYSSRNYASRLIGTKLIFYTPQYLGYYGDPMQQFPAIRKWHKGATDGEFQPIVAPTNVYRAEKQIDSRYGTALHTVTVCDLADKNFACKGTAVLGAPGRIFYVSQNSVYVWTTEWNYGDSKSEASSMLYKLPLDGEAPSALGVEGAPVDQFSFLESDDDHLNVLVRSRGYGEQMWGSEFAAGDVALLRTSLDNFSDGSESAARADYRKLPKVEGYTFQNRFVGDYLLYGTGSGWGAPEQKDSANLFAVNWKNGGVNQLKLKHGVDRIEAMGRDAVVVGTNGRDLDFTPVRLGDRPEVRKSYVRNDASQGELRSHGFFYKPDGTDSGIIGLPIAGGGRAGYRHLVENSASIIFIRNQGLSFDPLGELESETTSINDNCKASCVDWYGNARPIFARNRVFALLGYEIVEGKLDAGNISEHRRINFSKHYVPRI